MITVDINIHSQNKRKILSGNEQFTYNGKPLNTVFSDFAMWFASDFLDISIRGPLAEYIVARALGIDFAEARSDNQRYDLKYRGKCIEIKSSAYIQAWEQTRPSKISFSIRKAQEKDGWNYESEKRNPEKKRHSAAYVFCLYKYHDKETANPLMLDYWDFFVLPTKKIDELCGDQKNLSLSRLLKLNPIQCGFDGIKAAVDSIIE